MTPRGDHSPCSTVDAATVEARLVPDMRPAHAALCRDALLRRIWRRAAVGWFARPGNVQNCCRACRGTKVRGRAAARSRTKGARILQTDRVCGASARLAGSYEAREVATRRRASAVMWTSQEGGMGPNLIIIGRGARGILWKPSSRIASVGAEARGGRVFMSKDGVKFWRPTMASHGARLLLSVPPRSWR